VENETSDCLPQVCFLVSSDMGGKITSIVKKGSGVLGIQDC
jgi:hypothetical protein